MSKIPPIVGEVPADYDGPLYYRMENAAWPPFKYPFTVRDRKKRERLWSTDNRGSRIFRSGIVVDQSGKLLPEWTHPIEARFKANGDKRLGFMTGSPCTILSCHAHDAIKAFEPDSIFVPIEARVEDNPAERYYYYFSGRSEVLGMLSLTANNIENYKVDEAGVPSYKCPDWLQTPQFAYLDRARVAGRHILVDGCVGFTFSSELLNRLGDIFPKKQRFHPIGVA